MEPSVACCSRGRQSKSPWRSTEPWHHAERRTHSLPPVPAQRASLLGLAAAGLDAAEGSPPLNVETSRGTRTGKPTRQGSVAARRQGTSQSLLSAAWAELLPARARRCWCRHTDRKAVRQRSGRSAACAPEAGWPWPGAVPPTRDGEARSVASHAAKERPGRYPGRLRRMATRCRRQRCRWQRPRPWAAGRHGARQRPTSPGSAPPPKPATARVRRRAARRALHHDGAPSGLRLPEPQAAIP